MSPLTLQKLNRYLVILTKYKRSYRLFNPKDLYQNSFFYTQRYGIMHYPYNKVTGCVFVCVCLYQRISLTTKPIGFSFLGLLLIGPGKVFLTILGKDTTTLPREITIIRNFFFTNRDSYATLQGIIET